VKQSLRVGIIGAGLQGGRRAHALREFHDVELTMVADRKMSAAKKLAVDFGCASTTRWQDIIENKDINVVVVSTPPHLHALMSIAAMNAGKYVLCEKPLTRTIKEAEDVLVVAKTNKVKLKCGFNHRHHPATKRAKELVEAGKIGELHFIRCVYGIGGRPNYEKEWRADPKIVGGGQLMEQGVHAIDLFRWFLGDFSEVMGFTSSRFWKISPLEDNAFALFRTKKGQVASLHSSLTQWKNTFTFELSGQVGYIHIDGLGGSYGTERLTFGIRDFFAPFHEETTEFRGGDTSWVEEWREFSAAITENREPSGNGTDGLEAMRLVNAVYDSARLGTTIKITEKRSNISIG
jgi:predicted dehydrogenase